MKHLCAFASLAVCTFAGSLPFHQVAFQVHDTEGWTTWAPRAEIAPRTWIDDLHSRNGGGSLALSGDSNAAVFGGWQRSLDGIEAGKWYRFRAVYRADGLDYAPKEVVVRLDWSRPDGKRAGQPDYPWSVTPAGDWKVVTLDAQAPENATGVKIQLLLMNAPRATVYWDEVSLVPIEAPGKRTVVVTTVNLHPSKTADPVAEFLALLDRSLPAQADIALLPEGITVVGTGKTYAEVAEPVPGPTTARLGEFAKKRHVWVVAGVYERERQTIYNTAVLIDRNGRVAGRYRKVYIPREELEAGITPGSDYPVFQTDFGKVGMMICWDVQYADPARALALRGAEMILMPIWGGDETLGKARALENHVFLVASGYDYPTYIMAPNGEMLSRAPERGTVATAPVDLNRRYPDEWLGDMRARFMKELRLDTVVDPPGRQ
jgi:predicted amidohydrolase